MLPEQPMVGQAILERNKSVQQQTLGRVRAGSRALGRCLIERCDRHDLVSLREVADSNGVGDLDIDMIDRSSQ